MSTAKKTIAPLFSWRREIVQSGLPAPAKQIALTLALHMSEIGDSCFPSHALLATETSLSTSTVCTHLKTLETGGWLLRDPGAKGRSTRYFATTPPPGVDTPPAGVPTPTDGDEVLSNASREEPSSASPQRASSERPRNVVWDALVEVMGFEPKDGDGKTDFGKTVGQLRRLIPSEATFDECVQAMRVRRARFEQRFEGATFTHRVLRGRWDELGVQGGQASRVPAQSDFSGDSFGRELEDDGTGARTF